MVYQCYFGRVYLRENSLGLNIKFTGLNYFQEVSVNK